MGLRSGFQVSPFNSGTPSIGPAGRVVQIGDDRIAPMEFVGGFDPAKDALSPFLSGQLQGVGRRLESRADAPGLGSFDRLRASQLDRQAGNLASEARGQLASRGGLRSGAAERLEGDSMLNRLLAREQVGAGAEQARVGAEGKLADLGLNKAQLLGTAGAQDIAAKQREAQRATQFTKDRSQFEALAASGANQSRAIRDSGKGGVGK